MRTWFLSALILIAVAGCQSASQRTDAVPADAPQLVQDYGDRTTIYTCPTCKMEFDRAGNCTMCNVALAETQLAYSCPVDHQPVEKAGKCPRCPANAQVEKKLVAKSEAAPTAH